jgi:hypothetical protein
VIGTSGAISVATGAVIDASAHRPGDRLVRLQRNGVVDYMYVEGDQGGIVTLRAPVVADGGASSVNVAVGAAGSILGAREIDLEGFKRWDLAAVAKSGLYSGVTLDPDTDSVTLDVAQDLDIADRFGLLTPTGGVNFLGDGGAGTIVDFVQKYDVSSGYALLGGLAEQPNFQARPGIELDHRMDVILNSNWNLGAGVVDIEAAERAGLMAEDPVTHQPYVIPGQEAALLMPDYTRMTYRVGGKATGAAPILSLRAGGELHFKGSLTDGFFQFRDQYDPKYQSYLNGTSAGSLLDIHVPAYDYYTIHYFFFQFDNFINGTSESYKSKIFDSLPLFAETANPVGIDALPSIEGDTVLKPHLPFSVLANSPAAMASGPEAVGDPLANAVVMPLLQSGRIVASSSYHLVAGAEVASVEPMRTTAKAPRDLIVDGVKPQNLTVTNASSGGLTIEFINENYGFPFNEIFHPGNPEESDFINAFNILLKNNSKDDYPPEISTDDVILLRYVNNVPPNLQKFIRDNPAAQVSDQPIINHETGDPISNYKNAVTISVGAFSQFLEEYPEGFGGGSSTTIPILAQTLIRTGTGSIALGAAGKIDLTGGGQPPTSTIGASSRLLPLT